MFTDGFNPYFTGLPILINPVHQCICLTTYGFNPYFTGLPILIEKKWN